MITRDNDPLLTNEQYVFTLYVAGHSLLSLWAVSSVRRLCEENFHGNYELRVVDVYQYPQDVECAHVLATPTLIKHQPLPECRQIGYSIDMTSFTTSPT